LTHLLQSPIKLAHGISTIAKILVFVGSKSLYCIRFGGSRRGFRLYLSKPERIWMKPGIWVRGHGAHSHQKFGGNRVLFLVTYTAPILTAFETKDWLGVRTAHAYAGTKFFRISARRILQIPKGIKWVLWRGCLW